MLRDARGVFCERAVSFVRESSGGPEKVVLPLVELLLLPGTEMEAAPAAGSKNAKRWREASCGKPARRLVRVVTAPREGLRRRAARWAREVDQGEAVLRRGGWMCNLGGILCCFFLIWWTMRFAAGLEVKKDGVGG